MKKWEILYKNQKSKIKNQKLDSKKIVKILLENRGLVSKKDIEEFLNPKLENVTFESVGIDKKQLGRAIKRIQKAIENNEKIIIFGDYDVDGICGTAVLWEAMYSIYKNVYPYIPHRVEEGYGLSIKGIDGLLSFKVGPLARSDLDKRIGLIITVDNGVVAKEAVEYAASKNIDVIVSDHHVGAEGFLPAHAVLHTTNLCGAGVAFLLAKELKTQNLKPKTNYEEGLELVALATVADLVPLTHANRTLLKFGLERIRMTKRVGLLELFAEAGIQKEKVGVYEIGHIIGPRINAMGRLFHGMDSLRLICTKDIKKAADFASKLGLTNKERQSLTMDSATHAKSLLTKTISSSKIAFVYDVSYNQGVIGLIASKLVEQYYRPSFAISVGENLSKGSARSISGVNIIELIRSVSHTLVQAGGHPMAAGFTVETARIEEFRIALEQKAQELITDDHLVRKLKIDMELPLSFVTPGFYEELQRLSPFGIGNPEPTFVSKEVVVEDMKLLGRDKSHLKLKVSSNNPILGNPTRRETPESLRKYSRQTDSGQARMTDKTIFEAIGFGMGEKAEELSIGTKVDIAYTIDMNEWNGSSKLQLKVRDIKLT